MKRVAVFGNAGGGKSTLSRRLSEITGLPWMPLDSIQFKVGGEQVPHDEFKSAHAALVEEEEWIVDGFGSIDTVWKRLDAADTLVHLDMSIYRHYWWVSKRFLTGLWASPEGWPEGSSLLKGTLTSFSTVRLCHAKLTPRYREYVDKSRATKRVYHLRSPHEIAQFLQTMQTE